ncbi:MAG: cbb3-type cytochrome c oxidase subunit I [Planctomycetes bacterium]|nr:cbb3-type cytochrome c oxidase subunit I [Planctomycetota bacterium]MBI3843576.1 cbb3-type cytochrome c oxidase subunit I [Planctomycetota bacterium]
MSTDQRQPDFQPIHPAPTSFIKKYVFSTDHKVIAKQFLWAGMVFLLIGGYLAMMIRWQWAYPGTKMPFFFGGAFLSKTDGMLEPSTYTVLFTSHGLIMIFFAITPMLIGAFGNLCIPLMIGARDMAFPLLNMLSFWTFVLSGLLVVASFHMPLGGASAGWTTYPPLATNVGSPGLGQTLMVLALFVGGTSTLMGAINYVTTVIRMRAPGMTWMRMPLTVWGLWLTAVLNVIFVPIVAAAVLLLLFDRVFGTQYFIAGSSSVRGGGDPVLFQHLFWMFGHPEVYILILPVWGVIGDLISFFSRKPAAWYRGTALAMIAVTVLSGIVYGHHMYTTGMSPLLGYGFEMLTLSISIPAVVLFLNWLRTLWRGSIRLTVPMLFALGTMFVFGVGGLTGLFLGTVETDIYMHDTMFVVGHFHMTMAASVFLGTFAAIYFWFPKMFGRMMNHRLGVAHFYTSAILITLVFCGQMVAGYAGQQRRLYDPYQFNFLKHLQPLNQWTSYFAFALFASQIFFVVNFFRSLVAGERAPANPWNVGTLEWSVASPPPHHNFDVIPTVQRGPHEFADPLVRRILGRDWIGQSETLPERATPAAAATGGR